MRITFVHAPNIQYDQNYGTLFSPLWAYTLAAHVPSGWDVTIVDTIVDGTGGIERAEVFAFSGINQDADCLRRTFDLLKGKFPDSRFILGGPITWSMEQEGKLAQLLYFDNVFILDGEETLPTFLHAYEKDRAATVEKVIRAPRFSVDKCKPIRFDLYEKAAHKYYGAVVEVSRGCPFLCEFCDIRVLPGNNRANNKDPELIVHEMNEHWKLGVTQFQFACDNFIGDIAWARRCVDAILAWKAKTGAKVSIFTWLTINLSKMTDLMDAMRRAGFSVLFIGIESVNRNSLLETAKVQNTLGLSDAVIAIQSYGFIIAPGFIFGFDSDEPTVFQDTLRFLGDCGVIGGDPSFLMALPGTPLFERMKRNGRLITEQNATVRRKVQTNIRYLQNAEFLRKGFLDFIAQYTSAGFQLARFRSHVHHIIDSKKFVPIDGVGYGSPIQYLRMQWRDRNNRKMLLRRALFLLKKPRNFLAVIQAWWLIKRLAAKGVKLDINFNYWAYVWTNIGLKYWGTRVEHIDIESVGADFDYDTLLDNDGPTARGAVGEVKVAEQKRHTQQALLTLVKKERAGRHGEGA